MARMLLWRTGELFALDIILSAAITFLNIIDVLHGAGMLMAGLCLGAIAFIAVQFFWMRSAFFAAQDKKLYYIANYTAYMIFILVNIGVFFSCGNEPYAWLFAITKFVRFMPFGVSNFVSAVIFHVLMLLAVALAPVGMGWVLTEEEQD